MWYKDHTEVQRALKNRAFRIYAHPLLDYTDKGVTFIRMPSLPCPKWALYVE